MSIRIGKLFIDGAWIPADSHATFDVKNPATGEVIGVVPNAGRAETARAIAAAARAFPAWAARTGKDRSERLLEVCRLMLRRREDLARLITLEQGKPYKESLSEVDYAAEFFSWFAGEARRIYGETIPASHPDKRLMVIRQPIGVVAAISPWNFPQATITKKIAPALAAGCTAVVKPAEQTPLSAVALFEILEEAGIPPGAANLVTGEPAEIGREFLQNRTVRSITFTGSTEVGRLLMRGAADQIKKVALELGGHAPFLIFADADLEAAAAAALACKFRCAGQTCTCTNRIYVEESVAEEFARTLGEKVRSLRVGNGMDPATEIGPLIDRPTFEKVVRHVEDARSKGARVMAGGRPVERDGGWFYEPTLLFGATPDMLCMQEETFGPVAPVIPFRTEDEAVRMANDSDYGLGAYLFTRDLSRGLRVSERLEYGVVGLNDPFPAVPQAPFGGLKQSGLGREGGRHGMDEFLETKFISIGL